MTLANGARLAIGVFGLYTLITIAFFWQWVPQLSSALIGPPEDNMQDFWGTYYVAVRASAESFFFTDLLRFPEGTSLYYHAIALPKALLIALMTRLVGADTPTLVLLHNLALLVSFPLAGLGGFYLVRHLTGSLAGALVGGFIFGFNPSHVMHAMHHLPFSSMEFIPFFVLAYLLAIERRSAGWLAASVVFYALSTLLHIYYLFYLAYVVVFHVVFEAVRQRAFPRGWQLAAPVMCLVGSALVLSPVLWPMVVAALQNPSVYAPGGRNVADLAAYFTFPIYHAFGPLTDGVYWRLTGNVWESTVYLGLINLAVLFWLWRRGRNRNAGLVTYAIAGIVVFAVLASGSYLRVLGYATIPMPDMVLSQLPFFSNVRGPSRAIVVVYLFLAVLVGYAYGLAWRDRPRGSASWGLAAVAMLIVIDFLPTHHLPMTPVSCSPGYSVVREDQDGDVGVLNLPSGRPAAYLEGNYYMFHQAACHGKPICQGTTARDVVRTLRDRLETRDLQVQRRQLTEAQVKYVVIHHPVGNLYRWRAEDGDRDAYVSTYQTVYDGSDMTVLRVY